MFCHLHIHSEYSMLESTVKIDDLLEKVSSCGMKAVALTDKYVMSGCIDFYKKALQKGIKPIIGCEICVSGKKSGRLYHLTLIAKDYQGYQNLCRIVSRAHILSAGPVPCIKIDEISGMHKGLLALSGCINGEIAYLVSRSRKKLESTIKSYVQMFGEDFFLEVQRYPISSIPDSDAGVSELLLDVAYKKGIPVVASNDVHYLNKKDYGTYRAMALLKSMSTKKDPTFKMLDTGQNYFKNHQEMDRLFDDMPEALSNTLSIAEKCDLEIPLNKKLIPCSGMDCSDADHERQLKRICYKGLVKRYGNKISEKTVSRLKKELGIIKKTGFVDYFLIVADMAKFAYENDIPLCGKGSAAGSLVSYVLRISNVDPVENDLYFERFLNKGRKSLPDIDIDISNKNRARVIKYISSKYGHRKIARVCTFSTTKPRASIREAARILAMAKEDIDHLVRSVPDYSRFLSHRQMQKKVNESGITGSLDSQYDEVLRLSAKIAGYVRHTSMHPSAIIVSDTDFQDIIPLTLSETGEVMSQYDKESIESMGIMKLDLINSLSLCLISDVTENLKKDRGISLCLDDMDCTDPGVYRVIADGNTLGVFQLESFGIRTLARKVKPSSLNDITLLISLYRPGPQQSGMVKNFIERKFLREKTSYIHPDLKPILEETFGIILYQEQVMKTSLKIAGYSLNEADNLRKAMTRLSKQAMKEQRSRFIGGALKKGYKKEIAEKIFTLISKFASYGFVKAHAAAYAELSYKTCFLKLYYPAEFFSAILSNGSGYYSKIQYIEEARRCGVNIRPPDINKSDSTRFLVEDDGSCIRIPLISIKNLGLSTSQKIVEERKKAGPFKDFHDFLYRIKKSSRINSNAVINMIKAGIFDYTGFKRKYIIFSFEQTLNNKNWQAYGLFSKAQDDILEDFTEKEKIEMESDIMGFCIKEHPLSYFDKELRGYGVLGSSVFYDIRPNTVIFASGFILSKRIEKTKSGKKMLFCTMEDKDGMFEVVCFPDMYDKMLRTVRIDSSLLIKARLHFKDNNVSLIVKDVKSLISLKRATSRKKERALKDMIISSAGSGLWKT